MKVFHVTDRLPGYHKDCGGAEQASLRVIKLLNRTPGMDITVLSMQPEMEVKPVFKHTILKSMEYYVGRRAAVLLSGFKNRSTPFDPVSFVSSYRQFREDRPDIVHVHKATLLSFSVIQSAVLLKIPVVFSVYDYWCLCPGGFLVTIEGKLCRKFHGLRCLGCNVFKRSSGLSRVMLLTRLKPIFDYYLNNIDAFVVLSNASAELLKAYGINGRKLHVIPQVISTEVEAGDGDNAGRAFSIFFAGWMDRKKGLDVLIKAMPAVIKSVPDVRLYVFELPADDEYRNMILNFVKDNMLGANVTIYGRVSPDEFKKQLQCSDCVVVPEQWENMSPVIIAEALAHGKPVIATDIGGIPEFVTDGENGFLVKQGDSKAIAEKIIWMSQHREKSLEMGKKARQRALAVFNEGNIAGKYTSLYASVGKRLHGF